MNKDMAKNLRYGAILLVICAVCSLALSVVNKITLPVIQGHNAATKTQALAPLAGGMSIGDETLVSGDEMVASYYVLSQGNDVGGYILTLKGSGYGGEFTLLASYLTSGEVISAKMLSDSETPGLGKKSEEDWYMDKFKGTGTADKPVPTSKSMLSKADSDAISGASVTFGGVSKCIAYGSTYVIQKGGAK
ncbi:MAG: FMN-binding protein [Sphaerochaetaceae bacterium]|nr:FMN-binding protein [Spirochaetales bacterium]MDY5500131.1 FMN-binding protein [Sphaerochaetaceae bacterium]